MSPTSSRRRVARAAPSPASRARRPLGRGFVPTAPVRPMLVPFAAAFALLVAAEDGFMAWVLWGTRAWLVVAALVLGVVAVVGALLTLAGRSRGWLVLVAGSVLPLLVLLVAVLLLGYLGTGSEALLVLLLAVGPVGCLVLALQRPVRTWTTPARPTQPRTGSPRRGKVPDRGRRRPGVDR